MMPKSMSFKPAAGVTFESLNETPGGTDHFWRATAPPRVHSRSRSPARRHAARYSGGNQSNDSSEARRKRGVRQANDTRPGGGLGVPIDTPDPLDKYKWWILGAITLVFAVGAGFLLRRPGDAETAEAEAAAPGRQVLPAGARRPPDSAQRRTLRLEETDHLQGRLTDAGTSSKSRRWNWSAPGLVEEAR